MPPLGPVTFQTQHLARASDMHTRPIAIRRSEVNRLFIGIVVTKYQAKRQAPPMISSLSFYAQSIFLPPMGTDTRLKAIAGIFLGCALLIVSPANAQDASIDRLLSKLPPPEKIAKPNPQKALQQNDPAEKDPLVKQIIKAELTRNFPRALGYSRTLVERYPRSAGAQCLRGFLALALRQYGEASAALRASITLRPNLALAHYLLALM